MTAEHTPYLSVVVTSRNDDHGGDPLTRLQAFVNSFDAQCRLKGLDAEVIIVEWNPPRDKPRLQTLVRWPESCMCNYRFVEVPPEIHDTLNGSDVLPLFQMIAKNVGIRRARGRFVLATNIDILFSNELVDYIASGQLEPGYMYRVDRHDIEAAVPLDAPLDVKMAYCAEHQLRIHARWGSDSVDSQGRRVPSLEDIVDGRSVTLGSGWHVRENASPTGYYRWATDCAEVHVDLSAEPGLSRDAALEIELAPNTYEPTSSIDIDIVDDVGALVMRASIARRQVLRIPLQEGAQRRTFEFRVVAVSPAGNRRQLRVFERRGAMHYVVTSIKLTSIDTVRSREPFSYPASGWRAMEGVTIQQQPDGDYLSVVSNPARWSYCLEYGPLRAAETRTYQFTVTADIFDGAITLGVLSGDRQNWLAASVADVITPQSHIFTVTVSLKSGDRFFLMLSNDHSSDDRRSRFIIRELTGSVPAAKLLRRRIDQDGPRAHGPVAPSRNIRDDWPPRPPVRRMKMGPVANVKSALLTRAATVSRALQARIEQRKLARQSKAQQSLRFPISGWGPGSQSPSLEIAHRDDGVSVVSERRKWSYCIEYGPQSAPATGTYRFELCYEVVEGGVSLGVLSADRQRWLPSVSRGTIGKTGRTLTVSVRLHAGQSYWLMLFNDHPDGDGVSRIMVRSLTATLEVRDALSEVRTAIARIVWPLDGVTVARDGAQYTLEGWRAADPDIAIQVERTERGLSVATDPRRWSYCLEYGPLGAPAEGTYRFSMTYELTAGNVALGVLDRRRRKWLRATASEAITRDGHVRTLSVPLQRGDIFWLMVSNNHPDGDGTSRFLVTALTGSFHPVRWSLRGAQRVREGWMAIRLVDPVRWPAAFGQWIVQLWAPIARHALAMVRRAVVAVFTGGGGHVQTSTLVSRLRAALIDRRDRVRRRIVFSAPEYAAAEQAYKALEGRMEKVAPFVELDHVYKLLQDRRPDPLHLNGCGDFQLMAREHWFELRGYPEFQTFSMNIDGLFSNVAYYAGIRERALESPLHIFHLEHEVGSGWTPEGEAVLRRRIAERRITWLDSRDVFLWSAYMHWLNRPMIFNTSDWGLGALQLEETVVQRPHLVEPSRP